MAERFRQQQEDKATTKDGNALVRDGGSSVTVSLRLKSPAVAQLTLDTDESYDLSVAKAGAAGEMVSPSVRPRVLGCRWRFHLG